MFQGLEEFGSVFPMVGKTRACRGSRLPRVGKNGINFSNGWKTGSLRRMKETYSREDLIELKANHDVLVAIDSDGCVFDSMSIKQRIFHDGIIEFWGLETEAEKVRKLCEWVGLFSPWRGLNRFQLILKIFQNLEQYLPMVGNATGTSRLRLPTELLTQFVNSGLPLSMEELERFSDDLGLMRVLEWSREMSRRIAELPPIPMFDEVFQCLEKVREVADAIVVSQTTEDALVREWRHAGIEHFVDVIAGAELGSKAESLALAMKGRYAPEQVLMVGDAPGDLEAARAVGCLFFPIIPGDEVASWVELREKGLDRVLDGSFSGAYQDDLIARFNVVLSDTPPNA